MDFDGMLLGNYSSSVWRSPSNVGYTIVGTLDWFYYELETINLFYLDYKIGIFVFRYTQIHFTTGSDLIFTIPAVLQVGNC